METAITHLGNDQLHRNKSVMVEGGRYPRARVMNQHMIDQYLMRGLLNLEQHQAGEYLMGQALRAGVWASTVDLSGTKIQGKKRDFTPSNAFGFVRSVRAVYQRYGWFHSWLMVEVVIRDWDVQESSMRMVCLRQALDWIVERRMGGTHNPMRRLETAAARTAAAAGD